MRGEGKGGLKCVLWFMSVDVDGGGVGITLERGERLRFLSRKRMGRLRI